LCKVGVFVLGISRRGVQVEVRRGVQVEVLKFVRSGWGVQVGVFRWVRFVNSWFPFFDGVILPTTSR
jgi:hypothetical protein